MAMKKLATMALIACAILIIGEPLSNAAVCLFDYDCRGCILDVIVNTPTVQYVTMKWSKELEGKTESSTTGENMIVVQSSSPVLACWNSKFIFKIPEVIPNGTTLNFEISTKLATNSEARSYPIIIHDNGYISYEDAGYESPVTSSNWIVAVRSKPL